MKHLLLTIAATLGLSASTIAQVPQYVPTNGLIGWWPFTGNANDESGNGNNGTVNGTVPLVSDRNGIINTAYSFNGVPGNYINISNLCSQFTTGSISISIWASTNQAGIHSIFQQNTGSDANRVLAHIDFNSNGHTYWDYGNIWAGGRLNCNTPPTTFGNWSHYVFVADEVTNNLSIYKDGILVCSNTSANPSFTAETVDFGFGSVATSSYCYNGTLDDIGIWNRALTACEIQDLYSSQLYSGSGINAGNDLTVCQGDPVTLSGSGGSNYNWSGGIIDNSTFTPTNSQDYVLTGMSVNGCTGTDTVSVTVNQNSSATLNETGLDSVNVNGIWYTQNGQYTQLITNAAGCDSTITINVSLNFTNTIELPVQSFSIFPNPASSVVNIKADVALLGKTYSIYDLAGKVVLRGKLNAENTSIEVENLSGGIYLFSLGENIKQTFKVTKE